MSHAIDDNYTVQYYEEESTIDNEYLKSHDKVRKWSIKMPHEDSCSVCSPNLTNEKMLDYIVHGHSAKIKNRNSASVSSQTTVNSPLAHAIKSRHQSCTQKNIETDKKSYARDSITSYQYNLSPVEVLEEETNWNSILPTVFEEDNFSSTATELWSISNFHCTQVGENYKNKMLPSLSEGKYLPHSTVINHSAVTSLKSSHNIQESFTAGIYNPPSVESSKQTTSSTNSFPYVDEDDFSHTTSH